MIRAATSTGKISDECLVERLELGSLIIRKIADKLAFGDN